MKIPRWSLLFGPALSFGFGFTVNAIVMGLNGGQMPVLIPGGCPADGLDDFIHTCMTHASHLKFLADWVVMHDGIASPGDFFIWAGMNSFWPALAIWVALVLYEKNKAA